jgi:hypothetical protein
MIVCAVGILLLAALLVASSAIGHGGAKGTEVWWYEGNGPLLKASFRTTGSGIVQEWRYEPEGCRLVFTPADRFPAPNKGDYSLWTFSPDQYAIDQASPAALSDFFAEGTQYWLQIMAPN